MIYITVKKPKSHSSQLLKTSKRMNFIFGIVVPLCSICINKRDVITIVNLSLNKLRGLTSQIYWLSGSRMFCWLSEMWYFGSQKTSLLHLERVWTCVILRGLGRIVKIKLSESTINFLMGLGGQDISN